MKNTMTTADAKRMSDIGDRIPALVERTRVAAIKIGMPQDRIDRACEHIRNCAVADYNMAVKMVEAAESKVQ